MVKFLKFNLGQLSPRYLPTHFFVPQNIVGIRLSFFNLYASGVLFLISESPFHFIDLDGISHVFEIFP